MIFSCPVCGLQQNVTEDHFPVRCRASCDVYVESIYSPAIIGGSLPQKIKPPRVKSEAADFCRHRGDLKRTQVCKECGGVEIKVIQCGIFGECTIGKKIEGLACCNNRGAICPSREDIPPVEWRAERDGRLRVGFLAVAYTAAGGTETFHHQLLPQLAKAPGIQLVGFVSTWKQGGDTSRLGCQCGHGMNDARTLAASVDVLVEWGTHDLAKILPRHRPAVVSVHHGDLSSEWSEQMIAARLAISDCFACVHPAVAVELAGRGLTAAYVPNGVADGSLARIRQDGRRRVLWLGRFSDEKRPEVAIEIARKLPDCEFRIVGQGAEAGRLKTLSRRVHNVTIASPVREPWGELAAADVFLQTSAEEGFGYSVAEAMLAGVPVVSTPYGIAADPYSCHQVTSDAPIESWAAAITTALERPAQEQINYARRLIGREHSPAKMLERWQDVFCQLDVNKSAELVRMSAK